MSKRIIVAGGGISGLATAFRILERDPTVSLTILEPQATPGGTIQTVNRDGFRVETGPNGFLDNKPGTVQLCKDLGLTQRLIAASDGSRKNRYLFLQNKLQRMPSNPLGILSTPILTPLGRLSMLAEPLRRAGTVPKESVYAFAKRRFGKQAADTFIDALVTGIHGGDPEQLEVASAFPRLVQFEKETGSVLRGFLKASKAKRKQAQAAGLPKPTAPKMWSFAGGLSELIRELQQRLGDRLKCGIGVTRVLKVGQEWQVETDANVTYVADAVVLASPPHTQAGMVADLDKELSHELAGIINNAIAVVALGYKETDCPLRPDGFGYIAPQRQRRDILGVQWCSSIFPGRAPQGCVLWRALCGGVNRKDVCDWNDEQLAKAVHAEMKLAMGVTGEPIFQHIVRWPQGIPQYVIGHAERIHNIDSLLKKHPGLHLTGNGYRGIALNDCTEQAGLVAEKI